jgi:endonuclease-8
MPEGDTILRAARRMHEVLAGKTVTGFRSTVAATAVAARRYRIVGSVIDAVEARGKHHLVRFSSGVALHSHMGMTGSWHLYRPGSRWRKPEGAARAVVEAGDVIAVCFAAPTVEIVARGDEAAHRTLATLGPDILDPAGVVTGALAGLRARPEAEIGAALLDQAAVSGIGNIYKSEALFLAGVDPFARVADLDDAALTRVVRSAMREMRRSAAEGRASNWAYLRAGKPCRRCGTAIRMARQGPMRRSTYWCPRCQPDRAEEKTRPG